MIVQRTSVLLALTSSLFNLSLLSVLALLIPISVKNSFIILFLVSNKSLPIYVFLTFKKELLSFDDGRERVPFFKKTAGFPFDTSSYIFCSVFTSASLSASNTCATLLFIRETLSEQSIFANSTA